jgi:hypothetical protein
MRVKNWTYRELRERITDGYTLRHFTDFYCQQVLKQDAFNRAFNRLTPKTLRGVNELVVQAAVDVGLEDGQRLRVDSTVDRHSLPDRRHFVMGCRARGHALGPPLEGRSLRGHMIPITALARVGSSPAIKHIMIHSARPKSPTP